MWLIDRWASGGEQGNSLNKLAKIARPLSLRRQQQLMDSQWEHTKADTGTAAGGQSDHIHYPSSSFRITYPLFYSSLLPSHAVYTGRFNDKVCTVLIVRHWPFTVIVLGLICSVGNMFWQTGSAGSDGKHQRANISTSALVRAKTLTLSLR